LLENEQKLDVKVFVGMIYYVILHPYLLSFGSFDKIIFRILLVLFAFRGNKLNQENTTKRSKR